MMKNMESTTSDVCIPNISPIERLNRLKSGLIMLAFSLAVLTGLLAARISPWWRLGLFPFFAAAASGYFQWRDKT
jgi:hypothetical protein